ncbi:MAG: transpeptidase-transglycosylase, partial [Candidatus Eisenbacteria bacterium]|nr:transpeptidase-transglycosylase [Candidatus Eisenbacteria bacterium]
MGLIHAPNTTSPYEHEDRARARRDLVLHRMRTAGLLDESELAEALASPLPHGAPPHRGADASYFLEAAQKELERRAPRNWSPRPGTRVFTTMDMRDQAAAVEAVRQGLNQLERGYPRLRREKDPLEASAIVLDPLSGEVRALVGGRDFVHAPYDRATVARRQPGSLFKPIVFLAAFQKPRRADHGYWTPATWVEDEPLAVGTGSRRWTPQNYDREFRGPVSMRQVLEQSLNVPTVRIAQELGADRIVDAAHDLGVTSAL